jgi:glycolate oxidase FAD binding subunit
VDTALQGLRARVIDANATGAALRLRGAGTKDFYGEHCEGEILDLRSYCGVIDYDPSELVLSARCGTPLSEIEWLLAQHHQYLAFEPPSFGGDPSIGGVVAAGLSGPQRVRAGAVRDFVLGAVLLATDGELLHFGGRVMKNVAGFDLSRTLCGSLGIFGPILEVSLKVLPLPRAQQTLCFEMTPSEALEAFSAWAGQALPIGASAWVDGLAWVRLCGAESALRVARERLGGELLEAETAASWWQSLRDHTHPFFRDAQTLWRFSLPSTATAAASQLDSVQIFEWGGALRWSAEDLPASAVREQAAAIGGTAMQWRGGVPGQRFHPLSASVLGIHRRLKQRFDPNRIFNRGRLIAEL